VKRATAQTVTNCNQSAALRVLCNDDIIAPEAMKDALTVVI
jgi:hypothetical protein